MQPQEDWKEVWRKRWNEAASSAKGQWEEILLAKAPQTQDAIAHSGKRHVPCPVHGGKDGFRMFKDFRETGGGICNTCGHFRDGFSLLRWLNGWTGKEVLEEVEAYLGNRIGRHKPKQACVKQAVIDKEAEEARDASIKLLLNKRWREGIPLHAEEARPARLYLKKRGLNLEEFPNLLFHPRMPYSEGETFIGYFPCIMGMFQEKDGRPTTIHRIYITKEGEKAPVEKAKKMMPAPSTRSICGSAIRLMDADNILGIAEGIETALAVWQATGIPTWAVGNAILMEKFQLPKGIELLVIFADKDKPKNKASFGVGQMAAKKLMTKCKQLGIPTVTVLPKKDIPEGEKSLDWLDVLNSEGVKSFPTLKQIKDSFMVAA